ncbi:hypothetical protein [Vibrio sp. 10N.261.49.C12]|uniref:hypothetical protein n=1 Tax=Vibrio sp. 10N.261.49.C12 TaxID=3229671 RepID=UPI00354EAA2F
MSTIESNRRKTISAKVRQSDKEFFEQFGMNVAEGIDHAIQVWRDMAEHDISLGKLSKATIRYDEAITVMGIKLEGVQKDIRRLEAQLRNKR